MGNTIFNANGNNKPIKLNNPIEMNKPIKTEEKTEQKKKHNIKIGQLNDLTKEIYSKFTSAIHNLPNEIEIELPIHAVHKIPVYTCLLFKKFQDNTDKNIVSEPYYKTIFIIRENNQLDSKVLYSRNLEHDSYFKALKINTCGGFNKNAVVNTISIMLNFIHNEDFIVDSYNECFVDKYAFDSAYDGSYFEDNNMYSVKPKIINTCEQCKKQTKRETICYFCELKTSTPENNI